MTGASIQMNFIWPDYFIDKRFGMSLANSGLCFGMEPAFGTFKLYAPVIIGAGYHISCCLTYELDAIAIGELDIM